MFTVLLLLQEQVRSLKTSQDAKLGLLQRVDHRSYYHYLLDQHVIQIMEEQESRILSIMFGNKPINGNCINNHLFEKGQNQLNQTKATFGSKRCEFFFATKKYNNCAQDLQVLEVLGEIHGGGQVEDNMLVAWGKSQEVMGSGFPV